MAIAAHRSRFGFWDLSLTATLILTAGSGVSAGQAPHSGAGSNSRSGSGSSSQAGAAPNSQSGAQSNSQSGDVSSSQSGVGPNSQSSAGSNTKIAKDLQGEQHDDDHTVDVIVQFKRGKASGEAIQAGGGWVKTELPIVDGVVASLPAKALKILAKNPDVAFVSPNRKVHSMMDYSNPTVGADIARNLGFDGTGIGVAVIDSGVSNPPDLASRVVYSESFISLSANERYGHGTHVAGIIAGIGKDSNQKYLGIAPGANIVNLRVLDDSGGGRDSDVIKAIDRAIALKSQYNIYVLNLSLGRPVFESYTLDPLCQAVERAWAAGIVVVTAAGNEGRNNSIGTHGYDTIAAPGNDPYVITVGAMKTEGTLSKGDDLIASYSSKG